MSGSGRAAFLLAAAAFLVYNLNLREISSQDTIPARVLPVEVLREHRLDLDRYFRDEQLRAHPPYWVQHVGGHYVSSYPPLPGLLALPIYVLPVTFLDGDSWPLINALAKVSASLFAALSVLFVYLAARELGEPASALGVAVIYAFGTPTWSVASQGLWGHGPAQLGLAASIYGVLRGERTGGRAWLGVAGLASGVTVASRPTSGVMAAALTLYVLRRRLGGGAAYLAAFGAVAAGLAAYNLALFGSLQGGYAELNRTHAQYHAMAGPWETPLGTGILGLLGSPSRGLLVYSPVLTFAFAGAFLTLWRRRGGLWPYLAGGFAGTLLLLAKFSVWWGGHSFGPRLLSDVLPALTLFLVPVWRATWGSPMARAALVASFVASAAIHGIGAFYYPSSRSIDWDTTPRDVDFAHERLWDWRDPQIVRLLRNGPRPPGFGTEP